MYFRDLLFVGKKGLNRIFVEFDSQCVVDVIQRKEKMINAHYCLVKDINKLLDRRWEVKIAHIYREGNRCADTISNYALSLPQGLHILEDLPNAVKKILIEDIEGITFPCSCIT